MIKTLAISNYRSILDLVVPLGQLNVITGPNGSGKSNLYRALRLLAETARDGVVAALAREAAFIRPFGQDRRNFSRAMYQGEVKVEGTVRKGPKRMRMGFAGEDFSYSISLGLPDAAGMTNFPLDPHIKHEAIWAGQVMRPSAMLVNRNHSVVRAKRDAGWQVAAQVGLSRKMANGRVVEWLYDSANAGNFLRPRQSDECVGR
jgi:predicted ATPase